MAGRLLYGAMSKRPAARSRAVSSSAAVGWRGVWQRFGDENLLQASAALAFTTLFALVPLVALVLAMADLLPFTEAIMQRLEGWARDSLLPAGAAGTIMQGIGRFSEKARHLTVPGLAVLALSAFALMHTIERTFNHLWRATSRPLMRRGGLYVVAITVWPLVLGTVALAVSVAVTQSLGWFNEPAWLRAYVWKGASIVLLGAFFTVLYAVVPHARVPWTGALAGGVLAAAGFAGLQKLFEIYLGYTAVLKSVYGAFSVIPIFLVWLQASWAIVLVGALVAATLSPRATR